MIHAKTLVQKSGRRFFRTVPVKDHQHVMIDTIPHTSESPWAFELSIPIPLHYLISCFRKKNMSAIQSTTRIMSRFLSARGAVVSQRPIAALPLRQRGGAVVVLFQTTTRSIVEVPSLNDKTREIADKLLNDDTDPLAPLPPSAVKFTHIKIPNYNHFRELYLKPIFYNK